MHLGLSFMSAGGLPDHLLSALPACLGKAWALRLPEIGRVVLGHFCTPPAQA